MDFIELIPILAGILAVVATVLAFIFIVPEKKRAKMNKFGKFLHDTVNFKYLIIEKILQALYIFATATVIFLGFFMLFYVEPARETYFYTKSATWYGGYGLLLMILGPIAVRLAYEFLMMLLLLVKNVIQINGKLKNTDEEAAAPVAPVEPIQPTQPDYSSNPFHVAPAYTAPTVPVAPVEPVYTAPAAPVEPAYTAPLEPMYTAPTETIAPAGPTEPMYAAPTEPMAPAAPAAPVYAAPAAAPSFCPNCGTKVEGGAFCPNCGTRV